MYTIPTLYIDIPYETFRAFMRARQNQNFESATDANRIYIGCLQGTSFQKSLGRFTARHFFDSKIANPDLKEIMIIRLNMFLQFQDCIKTLE